MWAWKEALSLKVILLHFLENVMGSSYKETCFKVFSFPSVCHNLPIHQPCKLATIVKVPGVFASRRVWPAGQGRFSFPSTLFW